LFGCILLLSFNFCLLYLFIYFVLPYINLYSPKNGSNTKTQQYKHKYKQSENNDQVHHSS